MTDPGLRPHLLLVTPVPPMLRERLSQYFVLHDDALLEPAQRVTLAAKVRAMLCNAQSVVSRLQMQQWSALEMISVIGVGMDGIDLEAAAAQGIAVRNTPEVSTEDIADHTLALLLTATRQIVQAHQFVQQGRWLQGRYPPGMRFSGRRMGIVVWGASAAPSPGGRRPLTCRLPIPEEHANWMSNIAGMTACWSWLRRWIFWWSVPVEVQKHKA